MNLELINEIDIKDINNFDCGNHDLNYFFMKYALNNSNIGYGKTFVLYDKEIIGFVTLCASQITFGDLKNIPNLPRYPIPCIKIARLAVDKRYQGKGFGKLLLRESFVRIIEASKNIGIYAIIVDAKETSKSFYEKYGFTKLNEKSLLYYILLNTIKESLNK